MKFFAIFLFVAIAQAEVVFHGDQVLTLFPENEEHLELIKEFGNTFELADFWAPESASQVKIGHPADIRFPRHSLKVVKSRLEKIQLHYEVKIEDLQSLIDRQFDIRSMGKRDSAYDYTVYHTYDEILQWTTNITSQYPSLLERGILTSSTEGREVPYFAMGSSIDNPLFVIDCGIHAREWIAPAFCQYFVHRMVSQYGVDEQVTKMMDEITWAIIPLLNVDGYEYSWTDDRMWRKTRSNYGTACTGVDANRNYDVNFGGDGASPNPCSETYHGPSAESEPVIKASGEKFRNNKGNIKAYIAFHSYSQVFVYPYSYKYEEPSNSEQLYSVSERAANVIYSTHGKSYTWGPGYDSMYLVSGGAKDYAYDQGIPLSWTVELRDTGRYGFILPESQIQPTCEEMFQAMIVITDEAIATTLP